MGKLILNGKEYVNSRVDGYPPLIYSTDEREVGVWTDGKPLYQKTWELSNPIQVSTSGTVLPNNIQSDLADAELIIYSMASRNKNYPASLSTYVYKSSGNYYILSADNWGYTTSITIQYTKTTDVAGSGKYTTYGGLARHYSTTEQIIGTWIDGKPLYERTFNITSGISIGIYGYINLDSAILVKEYGGRIIRANGKSVDNFNGFLNTDELKMTIRSQGIEYFIPNIFSSVEALICTVQYTKTTD